MAVFAALDVRAFSGFYPSCSQCLRRVVIVPVVRPIRCRRPARYECRLCGVAWEESELEYRYCLTLAASQANGGGCVDIVVFGKNLDAIFGAPATHLKRFIQRHIIQGATPLMDPRTIFNIVVEPLSTALSGRYFTATITQSTHTSSSFVDRHGNPRYIAKNFSLLGALNLHMTVLSFLENRLLVKSPAPLLPHSLAELTRSGLEAATGREGSQLSLTDRDSILSSVTSTAMGQSARVSLNSFFATRESITCSEEDTQQSSSSGSNPCHDRAPKSASTLLDCDAFNHPSSFTGEREDCRCLPEADSSTKSGLSDSLGSGQGNVHLEEDVLEFEDVLEELTATWSEEGHTVHHRSRSLQYYEDSGLTYSDILPESESFLEKFQCDFDQSPGIFTSTVAVSLLQSPSLLNQPALDSTPPHKRAPSQRHSSLLDSGPKKTSSFRDSSLSLQHTPINSLLQFTPELFSGSISSLSHTSGGSNTGCASVKGKGSITISPELFSSPRPSDPPSSPRPSDLPAIVELSPEAGEGRTPFGVHPRQAPKRRLLHPLQSSLRLPHTHTPPSHVNDSTTNCFSPELFP